MIKLSMPKVSSCNVKECAYLLNNQECHAGAITVGDTHPYCDTFFRYSKKGGADQIGSVGACKMNNCKFNQSLECTASGVDVRYHEDHADCKTFSPR
jgi:hypothetical protein